MAWPIAISDISTVTSCVVPAKHSGNKSGGTGIKKPEKERERPGQAIPWFLGH
jgi:hypothetical protein